MEDFETSLLRAQSTTGFSKEILLSWLGDPELFKAEYPRLCLWQRHMPSGLSGYWHQMRESTRLNIIEDAYVMAQRIRGHCQYRNDMPGDETQCAACIRMLKACEMPLEEDSRTELA